MASTEADLSAAHWRRSSYSNGSGGECVEVAHGLPDVVPVRDSKTAAYDGHVLVFQPRAWSAFITALTS